MPHQRLTHVPALDGLRAIAVMAVVLFHLDFTWLPGGFVGVDVFFVLSGYLMMRIVIDAKLDGTYTAGGFLWRRFKRLAPALLVMTSIVMVVCAALYLPTDFAAILKSGIAANFYFSNIYYWFTLDYFDSAAAFAPFLHTWSLGVEGQFYLVLPLGLLIAGMLGAKNPASKMFFVLFALAALASFLINMIMVNWLQKSTGGFYFPATRFWEMLLGCLAALLPMHLSSRTKRPELLAWSGLGLVFLPMVLLSEDSIFPGFNALLPCLGAVMMISSIMHHKTWMNTLLEARPMQFLGKISYSLYLWHWPVIVIYKYWTMHPLGLADATVVFTVALILAVASFHLVENPLRKPWRIALSGGRAMAAASLPAVCLLLAVNITTQRDEMLRAQYPSYFSYFSEDYEARVARSYGDGSCFVPFKANTALPPECLATSREKPNILLIGDSHAAHLLPGLKRHFPGANILQANVAGCRALIDRITANGPMCNTLQQTLYGDYLLHQKPDLVVLAGRWSSDDLPSLDRSLKFLNQHGHNTVLVGPAIEYIDTVPGLLVRNKVGQQASRGALDGMRDETVLSLDSPVAGIARSNAVPYVSNKAVLCPGGSCNVFVNSGIPYQWDYGHYTPEGSVEVVGRFKSDLVASLDRAMNRQIALISPTAQPSAKLW